MTSSRWGMAMANASASFENTVKPLGAVILGAPDDELDFEPLDFELLDFDAELWVAVAFFLLPSSLVAKKTTPAMSATAATTIAMIGPAPSPERGAGAEPGLGRTPNGRGG